MLSIDLATLPAKLQPVLVARDLHVLKATVHEDVLSIETDAPVCFAPGVSDRTETLRVQVSEVQGGVYRATVTSNCPRGGRSFGHDSDETLAVLRAIRNWYTC